MAMLTFSAQFLKSICSVLAGIEFQKQINWFEFHRKRDVLNQAKRILNCIDAETIQFVE